MNSSTPMADLADVAGGVVRGDASVRVSGVRHDSRLVSPGELFVAIRGERFDGTEFIPAALERGAVAVVVDRPVDVSVPQLLVRDARQALGPLAGVIYGQPLRDLRVVGITGTNGKTTCAWIVDGLLTAMGERSALLSSIVSRSPQQREPARFTTPEADDIARFARGAADEGATHLVMEVSSHALSMARVDWMRFDVAAFTNLSQDHFDFHGDLESYRAAKARLFTELNPRTSVIHVGDPFGEELCRRVSASVFRVKTVSGGTHATTVPLAVSVREVSSGTDGTEGVARLGSEQLTFRTPLFGRHNLDNVAVSLGIGVALGFEAKALVDALREVGSPPGRLERIRGLGDVGIFVDYAHTPEAIRQVLGSLRSVTGRRLIVVFGCGGDRDRGKRPAMGEAAARLADVSVITNDNPRHEDPERIAEQIVKGAEASNRPRVDPSELPGTAAGFTVVLDREQAIRQAIDAAQPGDTVLIAGKGHEDYQIVGSERRDFDDRVVARAAVSMATGQST